MKKFDQINTPLAGKNLIEASAGTGKTYTIAGICVRLIVEKRIPLEEILVVTFTKAATEELKDRIRKRLVEAKEAFLRGSANDSFLNSLVSRHGNHPQAVRLIENALLNFDRAAIFTIHGFCQRILHENAFETGILFDTELIIDQSSLIREIADDFWRKHFYTKPEEFLSIALKKISGPEYYAVLLNKLKNPGIRIVPEIGQPAPVNTIPFREKFKKLKELWPSARARVIGLLHDSALYANVYGNLKPCSSVPGLTNREVKIAELAGAMDHYTSKHSIGLPLFKGFEKFTATKIQKATKKSSTLQADEIFNICDELITLHELIEKNVEKHLLYLKIEFLRYAGTELLKRKQKSNIQFFDDLLTKALNALEQEGRDGLLLQAARNRYRAALLDEFQDTDPVQFKIFAKIFNSDQHLLFMIGDPKQSIYSFRGADIFSYIKAASKADHKYTLTENWRSDPGLITAVNTIFSGIKAPFIYNRIDFNKVKPGSTNKPDRILKAPLQLWYLSSRKNNEQDKPVNKKDAVQLISEAVSCEIAELIQSKEIPPGDIAVLVRTNRQADIIKTSLSSKNIPSALYNTGNVFDSREAFEMEQILKGITEPDRDRSLKAALVTDIMGVTGDLLNSVTKDQEWWERRAASFNEYYTLWSRHGFMGMFGRFMALEGVRERLLNLQDGERKVTNILHLAEILHQKSLKLNISELLKWFSAQRSNTFSRIEEDQLRLESDEKSVRIITMHKSKGLEYRVVFCPYTWEGSARNAEEALFHDAENHRQLVLDLGSDQFKHNLLQARNETLAENIRLLYVALTRAKSLCYLVCGRINTAETSALSYILHNRNMPDVKDTAAIIKENFKKKTDDELMNDLLELADKSKGTIKVVPVPMSGKTVSVSRPHEKHDLCCRHFEGKIDSDWKISSYSSLVSHKSIDTFYEQTGEPEYPYSTSRDGTTLDKESIACFPRGAHAGLFFHDLFENLDFKLNDSVYRKDLVKNKLLEYNFDLSWNAAVCEMLARVISVPLTNGENRFSLATIASTERINEMEFYFALNPVSVKMLKSVFADYAGAGIPGDFPDYLEKLTFMPSRGFMKGYIDMVFRAGGKYYLLDWKSNFLGEQLDDYSRDSILKAMKADYYILQYHLYALALHQYLGTRVRGYDYSKDFGGIFYLFIRGVNPARSPDYGIYYDLPDKGLMIKLGTALIPGFK